MGRRASHADSRDAGVVSRLGVAAGNPVVLSVGGIEARKNTRRLLQAFVMQQYDLAPTFPELGRFLAYWRREIEAVLHSVQVAHKHLIGPAEWRAVDGMITIN